MDNEISYSIAAVFISFIILMNYTDIKKLPFIENIFFVSIIVSNMAAAVFSALHKCLLFNNLCSPALATFLISGYHICHSLTLPLMVLYLISSSHRDQFISKIHRFAISVPIGLVVLFILTTPFTEFMFSIGEDASYHRNSGIYLLYAAALYYNVYILAYILTHRKCYSIRKRYAVISTLCFSIASVVIQLIIPSLVVETCAIALSGLLLFFSIQNPHSMLDSASGAFNRSTFEQMAAVNFSTKKSFGIITVVLDDYNVVERSFGSKQSNTLLSVLKKYFQSIDSGITVYLFKNNIFCIEIINQEADSYQLMNQIVSRFNEAWEFDECSTLLSVKLCYIKCPENAKDLESLIDTINCFAIESVDYGINSADNFDSEKYKRAKIISEIIDRVIANEDLELMFDPVYSRTDNKICSFRVTIRFYDTRLGYVYYDEFAKIAETSGRSLQLGDILIDKVCRFISENNELLQNMRCVSIELSTLQCMQSSIADKFKSSAEKYGIKTSSLMVAVSEHTISKSDSIIKENLLKLHEMGIRLCLEDYGSGYSNISYIYDIPFTTVAVSPAVTVPSARNKKAGITLESTFSLMNSLGMLTCADGVDSPKTYEAISHMSCDFIKGKYIANNLTDNDLEDFVRSFILSDVKEAPHEL